MKELFERCSVCGHPYFEKHEQLVIEKDEERNINSPVLIQERVIKFRCMNCEHVMSKLRVPSEEYYEE